MPARIRGLFRHRLAPHPCFADFPGEARCSSKAGFPTGSKRRPAQSRAVGGTGRPHDKRISRTNQKNKPFPKIDDSEIARVPENIASAGNDEFPATGRNSNRRDSECRENNSKFATYGQTEKTAEFGLPRLGCLFPSASLKGIAGHGTGSRCESRQQVILCHCLTTGGAHAESARTGPGGDKGRSRGCVELPGDGREEAGPSGLR